MLQHIHKLHEEEEACRLKMFQHNRQPYLKRYINSTWKRLVYYLMQKNGRSLDKAIREEEKTETCIIKYSIYNIPVSFHFNSSYSLVTKRTQPNYFTLLNNHPVIILQTTLAFSYSRNNMTDLIRKNASTDLIFEFYRLEKTRQA